jgi:hypothetical protein
MATPLHTIEDVAEAIECVSAERLRIVLQDVIMKSPEACALLRSELIVQPKPKTQSQSQSGPRKRRKQETFQHRYERCKKYYQEYEITANSQEACTYHKGKFAQKTRCPFDLLGITVY